MGFESFKFPTPEKDNGEDKKQEATENKQEEESKALQEFKRLLDEIENRARRVVESNQGKINPEAAVFDRQPFIREITEISDLARRAIGILDKAPYADGKSQLVANTPFGLVLTAGDKSLSVGNMTNVHDFSFGKMPGETFGKEEQEKWVYLLQRFMDSAQSVSEEFKKMDEINNGKLTEVLNSAK